MKHTLSWQNGNEIKIFLLGFSQGAALSAGSVSCTNGLADHILDLALAKRESPASENAYLAELVAPCVEEIKASGADLSAYNTENNARDVQALMSALGYGTYNVYGISYGTRLALEVMRTVPQGVRSVVIDGVAPSFVPILDTFATPFADSMDKLAEQCAADEGCHAAYPDIAASFNAAFKKLGTDPIPGGPKDQVLDDGTLYHTVFELRNKWRLQYEITPYNSQPDTRLDLKCQFQPTSFIQANVDLQPTTLLYQAHGPKGQ